MSNMRFAGDALAYLRSLAETATIADVVRRHVPYQWRGVSDYGNIPALFKEAMEAVIDSGQAPTPGNIRAEVKSILSRQDTMDEDAIGILHDSLGMRLDPQDAYDSFDGPKERVALTDWSQDPYRDTPF